MEIKLKYGCNPHQQKARLIIGQDPSPLTILNGAPGYINILDAFGAWQLVKELRASTGKAAAASFKHVSPAGAAVAKPLTKEFIHSQFLPDDNYSPVATAYVRARGADRMSSFGDAAAVSDTVDVSLANILRREVSDLIIAPGYDPKALDILKQKKKGNFHVLQIDPDYTPDEIESRDVYGMILEQQRNTAVVNKALFKKVSKNQGTIPDDIYETLVVATIALKYTQSNSVCAAYDGQVIGMGAGQQSRIHCTRIACDKAEKWLLQFHPQVLGLAFKEGLTRPEKANIVDQFLLWEQLSDVERDYIRSQLDTLPEPLNPAERSKWIAQTEGICLSSDAFFPFRDNIDRANRTNVKYVAEPGNSVRDEEVIAAAEQYGMSMFFTDLRCFLH
ncbi:phosphoribosylaminoimidazolecarboxamide formyltransferase [candidate division KSB1 bacterium]|nr:phosphoribosylaminoimidazolecarboxamide formyltransferase [candidate division KSB1 bacterium]